jgi:hypothetical protein
MPDRNLSPEDRLDRVYRMVALVFLVIGALHMVAALKFVMPAEGWFTAFMIWVRRVVIIVVPVLCVLTIWRSWSFKRACAGCSLLVRDGFVFGAIQKSGLRAGLLGFVALVFLQVVAYEPTFPAKFFLDLALAVLTLTFSISFLVTSYVGNADE